MADPETDSGEAGTPDDRGRAGDLLGLRRGCSPVLRGEADGEHRRLGRTDRTVEEMRRFTARRVLLTLSLGAVGFVLGSRFWHVSYDHAANSCALLPQTEPSRPAPSTQVRPAAAREPHVHGNAPT